MQLGANITFSQEEFYSFQSGDEKAFRAIFDYYHPILFYKILRFSGHQMEAEEIAQEVFVQLFLQRKTLQNVEGIFPFLYALAKRMAISSFRKQLVRANYKQQSKQNWTEVCDQTAQEIEHRETYTVLTHILEELPLQQQRVFKLHKLEDRSYQEIADELHISTHTVRNHLAVACKSVRIKLQRFIFFIF